MSANETHVEAEVPRKSYREILREEIRNGWMELNRPGAGLFLSGLSAGLDLGFGVLLMAAMLTLAGDRLDPLLNRFLLALLYAVGFVFVNVGRSELFTEHTTLMMYPVLSGSTGFLSLARVWSLVFAGNLTGVVIFAFVVARFGPPLGHVEPRALGQIAHGLVGLPWWAFVVSGILAGWLMGLLSWLVAATQDTMGQIVCVLLIATAIGFAGLHHCVAGSVEVLAGVFAGRGASLGDYAWFLLWTTAGNIGGGAIFASTKSSHAVRGNSEAETPESKMP